MSEKPNSPIVLDEPARKRALRAIIFTQCCGMLPVQAFQSGFILAYFLALGLSNTTVLHLLAIPNFLAMILNLAVAYYSDRLGKKKTAALFQTLSVIGTGMICLLGSVPKEMIFLLAFASVGVYAIGQGGLGGSWFALLQPIIPQELRGRFLGQMRIAWQIIALIFLSGVTVLLKWNDAIVVFQGVIALLVLISAMRMFFYQRIPEVDPPIDRKQGFRQALRDAFSTPDLLPFACYVFLLKLFTGAVPWLVALLQKGVLGFTDGQIVMMGTVGFIGSIAGLFIGGQMVDRLGPKSVFFICHVLYAVIIMAFCIRDLVPVPPIFWFGVLQVAYGAAMGAVGIAISSEQMGLMPQENKSLATATVSSLLQAGVGLAGVIAAQALDLKVLTGEWMWGTLRLTSYDTLLIACAIMVAVLVVTLGLIPSAFRKAQMLPQTD